jgi:ketosteroid isomerase-like protein
MKDKSMIETPRALAQRIDAAFHARDIDALAEFWHDDIEYTSADVQLAGKPARKLAEVALLEAFPDARITERGYTQTEDFIAIEGTMSGTHLGPLNMAGSVISPTRRAVSTDYAALLWFREGRIVRQRLYYDRLVLAEQLGLVPAQAEGN